jgi:hypothetical protein
METSKNSTKNKPQNKITSKSILKGNIERVFKLLIDIEKTLPIFKDIIENFKILKGNNTYELNSQFIFLLFGHTHLEVKCLKIENLDYFKKVTYAVKCLEYRLKYEFSYCFYANTFDNSTCLVWDFVPENPKFLLSKFLVNYYETVQKIFISRWKVLLEKNSDKLIQFESILIHNTRQKVWEIVTNWRIFQKIVPIIADEVIYEGEPLEVGTKLTLIWNGKNVNCVMQVKRVKIRERFWEYCLEIIDGRPKLPNQEIKFILTEFSEDYTFVVFKHEYKQHLKGEIIDSISKDKKKILTQLKKFMKII